MNPRWHRGSRFCTYRSHICHGIGRARGQQHIFLLTIWQPLRLSKVLLRASSSLMLSLFWSCICELFLLFGLGQYHSCIKWIKIHSTAPPGPFPDFQLSFLVCNAFSLHRDICLNIVLGLAIHHERTHNFVWDGSEKKSFKTRIPNSALRNPD